MAKHLLTACLHIEAMDPQCCAPVGMTSSTRVRRQIVDCLFEVCVTSDRLTPGKKATSKGGCEPRMLSSQATGKLARLRGLHQPPIYSTASLVSIGLEVHIAMRRGRSRSENVPRSMQSTASHTFSLPRPSIFAGYCSAINLPCGQM